MRIEITFKVIGPRQDLDRFRKCCNILLDEERQEEGINHTYVAFDIIWLKYLWLHPAFYPKISEFYLNTNYYEPKLIHHEKTLLDFQFRAYECFPHEFFATVSVIFESLSFYCEAIYPYEDYCEFGWFNPPENALEFRMVPVPGGGSWDPAPLRMAAADPTHLELIQRLTQLAKDVSQ